MSIAPPMFPGETSSPVSAAAELSVPLPQSGDSVCIPCAERFADTVRALPGVGQASIDGASGSLFVRFDAERLTAEQLRREAEAAARCIEAAFQHRVFRVEGLDCAHCASGLEDVARRMPGIVSAAVRFSAGTLHIECQAEVLEGVERLPERVRALGFVLRPCGESVGSVPAAEPPLRLSRNRESVGWAVLGGAATFLALGFVLEHTASLKGPGSRMAFAAAMLFAGSRFVPLGLAALRERIFGTHLLMAVAAAGAVLSGQWEEGAAVTVLYAVGMALERAAMARTRRGIRALLEAHPDTALVQRASLRHETVPSASLNVSDVLVLRPGTRAAADGEVLSGSAAIGEAAITGEPLPKDKRRGDAVYAGSVHLGGGTLLVRVTAPASDSVLTRLLRLVEEAQSARAPTQTLIERFGRIYTPGVLLCAVLIAALGPLFRPGGDWLHRALTLLVVACPCALVIATPVAYVSALACAARNGVLVKGGAHLESLAAVRQAFLDKTGTLTTGELSIGGVEIFDERDSARAILGWAAAAARDSGHPVSRAIIAAIREQSAVPVAETLEEIPGRGLRAICEGKHLLVGNEFLLSESGIVLDDAILDRANRRRAEGGIALFVAIDGAIRGLVLLNDTVRPEASSVVQSLQRSGLYTALLTGDALPTAHAVAASLGITDVRAGLLPEDKLTSVRQAASAAGGVLFAGDGINDAPALAAATVGIAVGAGGTAAAWEAAPIVLTGADGLERLPWILGLASATRNTVRVNVALSLLSMLLLLTAGIAGRLPISVGVAAHEGIALLVILNGVRLLRFRLPS